MSCRPLRCPPNSVLAAEAPPDAFGIATGRHATVDWIISVTRLIPCAGAQYVTPAEKNMLLCEAAANGKLMKEYGIISRKPRALGYVAAGLDALGGRFRFKPPLVITPETVQAGPVGRHVTTRF